MYRILECTAKCGAACVSSSCIVLLAVLFVILVDAPLTPPLSMAVPPRHGQVNMLVVVRHNGPDVSWNQIKNPSSIFQCERHGGAVHHVALDSAARVVRSDAEASRRRARHAAGGAGASLHRLRRLAPRWQVLHLQKGSEHYICAAQSQYPEVTVQSRFLKGVKCFQRFEAKSWSRTASVDRRSNCNLTDSVASIPTHFSRVVYPVKTLGAFT